MDLLYRLAAAETRLKGVWFSIQHKGGGRGNSYLIKWTRDQSWVGAKREEIGPFADGQECVECAERLVGISRPDAGPAKEEAMDRTIAINPTYYHNVERMLFNAGDLDLIVTFTKTDPAYPVPFITEVTVNEGKSEDAIKRVRDALATIADFST